MKYLKKTWLILVVLSLSVCLSPTLTAARGEGLFTSLDAQPPVSIYLPIVMRQGPFPSVFGVETSYIDQSMLAKAGAIPNYWWRFSAFLWNKIEPVNVTPEQYDWGKVAENSLIAASQQGFQIIAVVKDTPYFAQKIIDPKNIPCSPIKDDQATIDEFIEFIHALAVRYSAPPYNIHYWQLGNEPDVDVVLFGDDKYYSPYGCWGDATDPYYGGEYYAKFLKIFSDTIKAVDPNAKITNGGLLLDCHPVIDVGCLPGMFFEGMIKGLQQHNALSALDYASYHAYVRWYGNLTFDENTKGFTPAGGSLVGKAAFLREVMTNYGLYPLKPLLVTEAGTMCSRDPILPSGGKCSDIDAPLEYSDDQAELVVRFYVRAIAYDITGVIWYTLNYQHYRHVGLLDSSNSAKPAYTAFQFLVSKLGTAEYVGPLTYPYLRAFEFTKGTQRIWVLWAPDQTDRYINIPTGFQQAYDKLGAPISVPPGATTILVNSPIYLILN